MLRINSVQVLFIAVNAAIGLAVGTASARSELFQVLHIPDFAWLVAGMLMFEMLAGLALKMHPAAMISMPLRVAGLIVSFVVCYATLGFLKSG